MTKEEQLAVENLIRATEALKEAERMAIGAKANLALVSKTLTELWWKESDGGESLGTIPDSFVYTYKGEYYLIEIDEDAEHKHNVKRIDNVF